MSNRIGRSKQQRAGDSARRAGHRQGSGRRRLLRLAAGAQGGHGGLQGGQALGLAEHLHQLVAPRGRHHHVAAQGDLGVVDARQDLAQAQGARPQRLVGRHVRLHLGQIEGGRQDVPVLLQHHQGMPAELLRLLAHLGEALHILRVEGHQGLDELLQRRNRLIQLGQAVRGELDGNQILGHGVSPVVESMGCPGDGRIIRLAGRRDDRGAYVGWVSSKWVMRCNSLDAWSLSACLRARRKCRTAGSSRG